MGQNRDGAFTPALEDAYLVKHVSPVEGPVLDLACGAGRWTRTLVETFGPGRVIGPDLSQRHAGAPPPQFEVRKIFGPKTKKQVILPHGNTLITVFDLRRRLFGCLRRASACSRLRSGNGSGLALREAPEAIRKNEKGGCPETDEDAKSFCVGLAFRFYSSGEEPHCDGSEDGDESENEADFAESGEFVGVHKEGFASRRDLVFRKPTVTIQVKKAKKTLVLWKL